MQPRPTCGRARPSRPLALMPMASSSSNAGSSPPTHPRKKRPFVILDDEDDDEDEPAPKIAKPLPAANTSGDEDKPRCSAPPAALVDARTWLRWASKKRGRDRVFGTEPCKKARRRIARQYTVDQLEALRHGLHTSSARHGPPGTSPCAVVHFTPDHLVGSTAPRQPTQVMLLEGKCGVGKHAATDELRKLARPQSSKLLSHPDAVRLKGKAVVVHCVAGEEDKDDEEDEDEDEDEARHALCATTVNYLSYVTSVLNLQRCETLLIGFNKLGKCRQVLNPHSTGKLATICDDLCDEEAAAADAQHIVEHAIEQAMAADPTLELDPHALLLPFHSSADSEAAKLCSGRRGAACGCTVRLRTNRELPEGLRDGVFEALDGCGVCEAQVAGVPHLGWVNGSKRLGEEPEGDGPGDGE